MLTHLDQNPQALEAPSISLSHIYNLTTQTYSLRGGICPYTTVHKVPTSEDTCDCRTTFSTAEVYMYVVYQSLWLFVQPPHLTPYVWFQNTVNVMHLLPPTDRVLPHLTHEGTVAMMCRKTEWKANLWVQEMDIWNKVINLLFLIGRVTTSCYTTHAWLNNITMKTFAFAFWNSIFHRPLIFIGLYTDWQTACTCLVDLLLWRYLHNKSNTITMLVSWKGK